jgi:hypothetical protein
MNLWFPYDNRRDWWICKRGSFWNVGKWLLRSGLIALFLFMSIAGVCGLIEAVPMLLEHISEKQLYCGIVAVVAMIFGAIWT